MRRRLLVIEDKTRVNSTQPTYGDYINSKDEKVHRTSSATMNKIIGNMHNMII